MKLLRALCATAALVLSGHAFAYQDTAGANVPPTVIIDPATGQPTFTAANPGKITGTFSATINGFQPTGSNASLSASDASSHQVALPTGTDIRITNTSTSIAYCNLGTSGSVTAGTTNTPVPGNYGTRAAHIFGSSWTNIACVSPGSTLAITIEGGTGLGNDTTPGSGGSGSGTADVNESGSGTISAANNFSTGMTISSLQNVTILTGTPTTGSTIQFTGFSGYNSGWLECTGSGLTGSNVFEVDVSGPSGGTYWKRIAQFSGVYSQQYINLANATFLQVMADTFVSGSPTCTLRLSADQSTVHVSNILQAGKDATINIPSTTAGTALVVGIAGLSINVSYNGYKVGTATSISFGWTVATNCSGTLTVLDGPVPQSGLGDGMVGGTGGFSVLTIPVGDTLCIVTNGSVGGHVHYTLS